MTTNHEKRKTLPLNPFKLWGRWMAPSPEVRERGRVLDITNTDLRLACSKLEAAGDKLGQLEFRHAQRLLEAVYKARLSFGRKLPEEVAQEMLAEIDLAIGVWGLV